MKNLTKIEFDKAYEDGRVFRNESPCGNYHLYNYKPETQFKGDWDEVTLHARGIIFDKNTGEIAARGFRKFFNFNERFAEIGTADDGVKISFEKMDGSLGLIWWDKYAERFRVTTRGSFASEQAIEAEKILYSNFSKAELMSCFMPLATVLVEIIYPENKICVNYGDERKLVILGVIENETGMEYISSKETGVTDLFWQEHYDPFWQDGRNWLCTEYSIDETTFFNDETIELLKGREGIVLTWYNPETRYAKRVKLKTEEYVRLHRIRFDLLNPKRVWEYLAAGFTVESISTMLSVEDEQFDELKRLANDILVQYAEHEKILLDIWKNLRILFEGKETVRKDWAMEILKTDYKQELFAMLDNRDYFPILIKRFEP